MKRFVITLLLLVASHASLAKLQVLSCEPEWAALAREMGGSEVEVFSATTALQDPHSIQARPSLIAQARQADLLLCTGAGLEAGWLPLQRPGVWQQGLTGSATRRRSSPRPR